MTTPTPDRPSVPVVELAGGAARRLGRWAVGLGGPGKDEPFAVSRRCRHQLGDLSKGTVDSDGCLVCPWHGARYDVSDGRMVAGPKGFLGYHGRTPGYSGLILATGKVLKLAVGRAVRRDDRVEIE